MSADAIPPADQVRARRAAHLGVRYADVLRALRADVARIMEINPDYDSWRIELRYPQTDCLALLCDELVAAGYVIAEASPHTGRLRWALPARFRVDGGTP